jgi:hypothetical protein
MDNPLTIEPNAEEVANLQAAIQDCLVQIENLRERMKRDQVDIERSRMRTRAILAQLKAG